MINFLQWDTVIDKGCWPTVTAEKIGDSAKSTKNSISGKCLGVKNNPRKLVGARA